jgi:tetratricopeptide (TPR) repeat protein
VKIAVYALARNEEKHAAAWEECCRDADYRVVTDTGSTDRTPEILRAAGVTVCGGNVLPWRWDEAHNLSMHHVPADADICIRLDLDERLQPGWRDALLEAWTPGMTKLRYWYAWNLTEDGKPLIRFHGDRVHSRVGYRWVGATHEGLTCWAGDELVGFSDKFEIYHYRDPGKKHETDLTLLRRAVHEMPQDARMQWYLARQLFGIQDPEAVRAFEKYLEMPGGTVHERAFAYRALAQLVPEKEYSYLQRAIAEHPASPDAYYDLAKRAHAKKDHMSALYWAARAVACSPQVQTHTSDLAAYGPIPADIASVNAFQLGMYAQALHYAEIALSRNPTDERLQRNAAKLRDRQAAQN